MKAFRKNVAIAVDGGGIRGVMVARALSLLEARLGRPLHEIIRLTAGTSTGSIIAAGLAGGLSAEKILKLYVDLGRGIFRKSIQTALWPVFNHRYPRNPLEEALKANFGDKTVGDLWKANPPTDIVLTTFDIVENRTRFIKSYKSEYQDWPLVKALLASAAAPTYFPSVDGRFIDGGVGSYNNPCYLAAYEIQFSMPWKPEETTLISIGTGREPGHIKQGAPDHYLPIQYISPLLDAFSHSAADQQVDLVRRLFPKLDFRRFQVDLQTAVRMDDTARLPELISYGEQLGDMMLADDKDRAMYLVPDPMPRAKGLTSRRRTSKSGSPRASRSRTSPKSARARRKR